MLLVQLHGQLRRIGLWRACTKERQSYQDRKIAKNASHGAVLLLKIPLILSDTRVLTEETYIRVFLKHVGTIGYSH